MEHTAGDAADRPRAASRRLRRLNDAARQRLPWRWESLQEGVPLIAPLVAAGAAAARAYPPAAPLALLAAAGVALAFRDPERAVVRRADVALAPADGRVLYVERAWDQYWETEMVEIAIFLALWDVHVQRSPLDGEIVGQLRRAGGYRPAMTRAATHGNHQLSTYLRTETGPCTVTQISGMLARRIVSWAKTGDRPAQGQRLGMIRFGSQVTLRLPPAWSVTARAGDRVRAGLTPLALRSEG